MTSEEKIRQAFKEFIRVVESAAMESRAPNPLAPRIMQAVVGAQHWLIREAALNSVEAEKEPVPGNPVAKLYIRDGAKGVQVPEEYYCNVDSLESGDYDLVIWRNSPPEHKPE